MAIFNSYVKLPEGKYICKNCNLQGGLFGIAFPPIHGRLDEQSLRTDEQARVNQAKGNPGC